MGKEVCLRDRHFRRERSCIEDTTRIFMSASNRNLRPLHLTLSTSLTRWTETTIHLTNRYLAFDKTLDIGPLTIQLHLIRSEFLKPRRTQTANYTRVSEQRSSPNRRKVFGRKSCILLTVLNSNDNLRELGRRLVISPSTGCLRSNLHQDELISRMWELSSSWQRRKANGHNWAKY